MNRVAIVIIFCCAAFNVIAQSNVSGRLRDAAGAPVAFANVMLIDTVTKTLTKANLTSDDGSFVLENIPNGSYLLKASHLAFEPYTSQPINVNAGNVTLQDISLQPKATTLTETTVTAQRPFIEVKQDKLVVNVENSIVSAGSTALEILARSPGVHVDQNDNIALKGKQGVLVMIDDKLVPVSGQDLANMLKNMPSNQVGQIEIITNPSAKYDAAGNAGIINIKTKRDKRMGFNGSLNANAGHGEYPKAGAGLNLNYRNKLISAYANYNYNHRRGFNHLTLERHFYDNPGNEGSFSSYDQDHYIKILFATHSAGAGVDFQVSRNTTIGVSANGLASLIDTKGTVTSLEKDTNRIAVGRFDTQSHSRADWDNYTANINLRHTFDTVGRALGVDADYAHFWNTNDQSLVTDYFSAEGIPTLPTYVLTGNVDGVTDIKSVKADYTHPLRKGLKLEAGAKASFVTADNDLVFYDESNPNVAVYDSSKSNRYVYEENINAAYVNASKDFVKWSFQFGLRVEQTNVHGVQKTDNATLDTSYTKLFPSLALQRRLNANHDIGLTLSRRIDRPDYKQLNPFRYYLDPSTFVEGNPTLGPQLTYSAEVSHTYKQRFLTSFRYSVTTDVIVDVLLPYPGNLTVQTNRNVARNIYYGFSLAYPFEITKWWTNTVNANAYYSRFEGNLANTTLREGEPAFDLNSTNAFTLSGTMAAEVTVFYQSRQTYGFLRLEDLWSLNLGVQKSFFKRRLSVKANVTDVFYTSNLSAFSSYATYTEGFTTLRDTRVATLSVTYRFGNNQVAPVRKHQSGAEEEMNRVKQQ